MEPALIDDIESSLDAQRTELANQLRQLRESLRFANANEGLAEAASIKAYALGASIASEVIRNPIPLAIAGSLVLLLLANRRRTDPKSSKFAVQDLGTQPVDRRSAGDSASRTFKNYRQFRPSCRQTGRRQ